MIVQFMLSVQKLFGRWSRGDFYGIITSKRYFNCLDSSCPFSVKLVWPLNEEIKAIVEKVIFPLHCHEHPENSKRTNRLMIEEELRVIERGEDIGNAIANKHVVWQENARKEGENVLKALTDKDDAVE